MSSFDKTVLFVEVGDCINGVRCEVIWFSVGFDDAVVLFDNNESNALQFCWGCCCCDVELFHIVFCWNWLLKLLLRFCGGGGGDDIHAFGMEFCEFVHCCCCDGGDCAHIWLEFDVLFIDGGDFGDVIKFIWLKFDWIREEVKSFVGGVIFEVFVDVGDKIGWFFNRADVSCCFAILERKFLLKKYGTTRGPNCAQQIQGI